MMKLIELKINNRYLFSVEDMHSLREGTLCEISPSGTYYKMHQDLDGFVWFAREKIKFIEDLGTVEVPEPKHVLGESMPDSVDLANPKDKKYNYTYTIDISDGYVRYRFYLPSDGSSSIADIAEACSNIAGCGKISPGSMISKVS